MQRYEVFCTRKIRQKWDSYERTISAYKHYFRDFIQSLSDAEARKVFYVIDMLKTQERVNAKFVKYLRDEISRFAQSMVATSSVYSSSSTTVMW